jgi:mitochondrial fission protein ELM1
MITPSWRTLPNVVALVRRASAGACRLLWEGSGSNPYPAFLAQAEAFIAAAHSLNMTGEPHATGKPVHALAMARGAPKFLRFHEALRRRGATGPLWAPCERLRRYVPLSSSQAIAAEIAGRRVQRRQTLGERPPALASEA